MKKILDFSACLAFLVWAAPCSGQVIKWDDGQDPVRQLDEQRKPFLADSAAARRQAPNAAAGLVINAEEVGIAKFHRYDNGVHPYGARNAWAAYVVPDGDVSKAPMVLYRADGSVTIVFSNLEELLQTLAAVVQKRGAQVSVLNIHAHGMPGVIWLPKDKGQKESAECRAWAHLAGAPDKPSYDMYYEIPTVQEMSALRRMSETSGHFDCMSGAAEWREIAGRIPNIKDFFSSDARIHFQSCLVGLGPAGETFAKTVAGLLLSGEQAHLETSMNIGLGDWSMPEGMGFWDYLDDAQLARDAAVYSKDRMDREIMQKGTIRVASYAGGAWTTALVGGLDFMTAGKAGPVGGSLLKNMSQTGYGAGRARYEKAAWQPPAAATGIYGYILRSIGETMPRPASGSRPCPI